MKRVSYSSGERKKKGIRHRYGQRKEGNLFFIGIALHPLRYQLDITHLLMDDTESILNKGQRE